jgi:hypothetical protein
VTFRDFQLVIRLSIIEILCTATYVITPCLFDRALHSTACQMKAVLTLNILLRNRLAPSISAQLSVAAEDLRCAEVVEDISFSLPDTFIQPFREDRDSRNEYKSQVRILLSVLLSVLSLCLCSSVLLQVWDMISHIAPS